MKYKVIDYFSDVQEEQTGTCDLCFGTAWVENGSITVEDETGRLPKSVLLGGTGVIITQSILITW